MILRTPALLCVLLILSGGCAARHGRPILGGSVIPNPTGTISGKVMSSTGTPLDGRRVSAIAETNEMHYDATTAKDGGYTIKVPPGRYRLEVELRGGDQLARQPMPTQVNIGDVDEKLDFVIGR